ncbi:hydrogenase small subunit [Geosporobacter subterraneus DSM 17957]|uniref:Hydrogenase small subunit n=1 Tax=Geosporobacter subterraneus DSM 17957 TaxID=1121919 RepID=A0A1M6CZN0_9FIRM|nr:[NiFe] hydrogenase small subunit HydA [Geosporobacter subterraneus]SHI66321.1 hydrogenase small subunit [Geosporobacter subterraneus DSM 17957]
MKISRRDFIKWMTASATVLGMGKVQLEQATHVLANMDYTPVIWIQAAGCSGCTISFLNMVEKDSDGVPTVDKMLTEHIDLKYHSTLMAAAAKDAMEQANPEVQMIKNNYILIVEGAIPTAQEGIHCIIGEKNHQPWTALQAVRELAADAKHIIAIGTCAAFRGVAGAGSNSTAVRSVEEVLGSGYKSKIVNLPGCPVHPYIIGETIIKLIAGIPVTKDSKNRPLGLYSEKKLHDKVNDINNCPLKGLSKTSKLGVCGNCFDNMGCKGKDDETRSTCYTRYWGIDWNNRKGCFGTGNMCIGCSSSNFPFSKIYN